MNLTPDVTQLLYGWAKSLYEAQGFEFETEPGKLNIFGLRTGLAATGKFDDHIGVAYVEHGTEQVRFHLWDATTDPGYPYMRKPINKDGCAILAEGQYSDCYMIGKHRGEYDALVQSGGRVRVYRDNDKNLNYNYDPKSIQTGWFGINIHKRRGNDDKIRGASAGCQVFRYAEDFEDFMSLCKEQRTHTRRNKFTYTLFRI